MSRCKKLLAFLLALSVLLSMLPVTALAAETEEVPAEVVETGEAELPEEESAPPEETAEEPAEPEEPAQAEEAAEEEPAEAEVPAGEEPAEAEAPAGEEPAQEETPAGEPAQPAALEDEPMAVSERNGVCGDNLTWILDDAGTLTIFGTGAMYDWDSPDDLPWGGGIKAVHISDGVTSIGNFAFYSDYNYDGNNNLQSNSVLTSVRLPDSLVRIGDYAFYGSLQLTSLTIPNGVTSIGEAAFHMCGLTSITLPSSVTSIGDSAFHSCDSLTSVTVPDSVTTLGEWAFASCDNLTSVTLGKGITRIASDTFCMSWNLANVTLPDSLTSIDSSAFEECGALTSIRIPASVTSIGESAFQYSGLTSVSIPGSVASIGLFAFLGCDDLATVTFGNGVTSIGNRAFEACTSLTSVKIPGSISEINWRSFASCTKLTSVEFAEGVTSIDDDAFWGCDSLTSVKIPNSMTSIGYYAFADCPNLTSVTIPASVTNIDTWAFGYRLDESGHPTDPVDGFTIYGYANTEAERYAAANNFIFVELKVPTKLDTPVLSSVSNTVTGVQITWKAVTGAEKYRLYRKTSTTSWAKVADTTNTSYLDAKVGSGTTYTYTVRCMNSAATAFTSDFDTVGKSITYIAAPVLSKVENITGGVTVSWGKVNGAAKYRVFCKTGDGSWKQVGDTTATSLTVKTSDGTTALKSGTTYTFTVRCLNSAATAYTSSFYATGKSITYIATPVLTAVANASGGVQVTWSKVTGAAQYRVYRRVSGGSWTALGNTTSTSYTDTTAAAGTLYAYTVRCVSADGKTLTSGYDTTGKGIVRLTNPAVTVANATAGVNVQWSKVAGAKGYYVYRKTGSGSYSKIATITSGSTVSYGDKTAVGGTTYTYTVRAYNGAYLSSFAGKSIVRLTNPAVTVTNASGGVVVSWNKVAGATGYYVYRKTSGGSYTRIKTITSGSTVSVGDTAVKSTNGTLYTYTVRAYNSSVLSSFAGKNIVRLTTPTISSVTNSASQAITVKWNRNTAATGYQIYYKTGSTAKTVTVTGSATVSKVISGLTAGSTYSVYVRSYKTVNSVNYYSGWSSAKSVKIAAVSTTVYITETGDKYHAAGCRYLGESKIAISLSDAKARGYTPCSVCKPAS